MFEIKFPICLLTLSIYHFRDFYHLQHFPSTKHTVPVLKKYQARNPTLRHQFYSHWPLLCTVNDNNTCSNCHVAAACSHNLIEVMWSRYPWLWRMPAAWTRFRPLPRMSSTYNWFPDSTNVCKGLQRISTLVGAAYITDTLLEQTRGFFYYMKTFLERATSSMSPECWIGVVQLEIYVLYSANLKILDELFYHETYIRINFRLFYV
jgi:hypothetical protein